MLKKKIGIIGCGNMGEALLGRLSNIMEKSAIMASDFDAKRREYVRSKHKIVVGANNNEVIKFADVIILAVKPKDFEGLLKKEVRCQASKDKLLISIAAGITTKYIEKIVGSDIHVIRVMPNMAAAIGEAVSSISAGSAAGPGDMKLAKEIFSAIGDVVEVDESMVDAVTAISGSGPAYFFYLIESLIDAAVKSGLDKEIAKKLVLKTALGSAKLLEALKEGPDLLRKRVTSKGGTTEAAFKVFEAKKFKSIIEKAVKAALKRSKELSFKSPSPFSSPPKGERVG